ncbi:MAG TPA: hypothetical protein VJ103_02315 [Candidatus Paceibacterota bacterium]|nr:hypothetical protein [Candidatus Paceibacterota bacterium]
MSIFEPGEGAEGMLKWILWALVFLFVVWFVTGGPERYKKLKPGPFEEPPPPPVVTEGATQD